ncbi:hypothetical protein F442_07152, partial [Phytophthora nicotianae P10297]
PPRGHTHSLWHQAIEWVATEGGEVPSRAVAHFRQREWRITASCFRLWRRDREQIMAEHGARRRIVGGGRRPLLGAVEDALVDLIYEKRIRKEKVSRSWIALMALELFHQSRTEEKHEEDPIRFVASPLRDARTSTLWIVERIVGYEAPKTNRAQARLRIRWRGFPPH